MNKFSRFTLIGFTLFAALALTGCAKTNDRVVNLMVNNQAKEQWFIWIGESTKVPEGYAAIMPGGFRPEQVGLTTKTEDTSGAKEFFDDTMRVHASKDGKDVVNERLNLNSAYDPNKQLYVRWDGKSFSVGN